MEVPSPGGRNCCEGVCTSSHAQQAGAAGRDRQSHAWLSGHWVAERESGLGDTLGEGGTRRPGGSARVGRRSLGQAMEQRRSQEGHVGPATPGV